MALLLAVSASIEGISHYKTKRALKKHEASITSSYQPTSSQSATQQISSHISLTSAEPPVSNRELYIRSISGGRVTTSSREREPVHREQNSKGSDASAGAPPPYVKDAEKDPKGVKIEEDVLEALAEERLGRGPPQYGHRV